MIFSKMYMSKEDLKNFFFCSFVSSFFTCLSRYGNNRLFLLKTVNSKILKNHLEESPQVQLCRPEHLKKLIWKVGIVWFRFHLSYFCNLNSNYLQLLINRKPSLNFHVPLPCSTSMLLVY